MTDSVSRYGDDCIGDDCPEDPFGGLNLVQVLRGGGTANKRTPCLPHQVAFITAHSNAATEVASRLQVPPANLLGLSAEESEWGQHRFARDLNNFFGQHAGSPGSVGTHTYTTPGGKKVSMAIFEGFPSSVQSFETRFGSLVHGLSDPTAFAKALVPKFNTANAATGGNPKFVPLVSATIRSVSACIN